LFQTIICAIPSELERAAALRCTVACMAFGVGPGLSLISRHNGARLPGGLMALDDTAYDKTPGDPGAFAAECLRICRTLGFEGLVLDFEQPVRRPLAALAAECAEQFLRRGFPVYLPERYAECHRAAMVCIPTAMTSGSLRRRLRDAVERYGAGRVALEMERLTRDIALPCPGGFGRPMHPEGLRALLRARGGASFYSAEMCTHYFTERDRQGVTHFYIYDDALSIARKTELAAAMGIRKGLILYPDTVGLGV